MKLSKKILCSGRCKRKYHQIGLEPLPDCNRTRVARLEEENEELRDKVKRQKRTINVYRRE